MSPARSQYVEANSISRKTRKKPGHRCSWWHTLWKLRKFTLAIFWQKFWGSNANTKKKKNTKNVDLTKYFYFENFPRYVSQYSVEIYVAILLPLWFCVKSILADFRRSKTAFLRNSEALNFHYWKFHTWKCEVKPKRLFLGLQNAQNGF